MKNQALLCAATVALLCLVGFTAQTQIQPHKAVWEYKIVQATEFIETERPGKNARLFSESTLSAEGAQGWELVGYDLVPSPNVASLHYVYYYLKRQK